MVIEKLDLLKADPNYYKIGTEPELRDLDSYYYLTVEGQSSPEDPVFHEAIGSLYSMAYGIKFLCKAEDMDFTVPKMEGFWWVKGGLEKQVEFVNTPREKWCWKIIIRMPDYVEETHFFRAMEHARQKQKDKDIRNARYELINEGRCAQILHVGSYEDEDASIRKLHQFIDDQELNIAGYHHEIYLSDPLKTRVEKLRTIIRYAVK